MGATTCGMVEYPRQESNNQQILRDVWKNQKRRCKKRCCW